MSNPNYKQSMPETASFSEYLMPCAKEQNNGPTNFEIMEKLETIERKLDLIFGNYALINGRFIKF